MYLIQHVLIEHEKEAINSATHTFLSLTYVESKIPRAIYLLLWFSEKQFTIQT